MVGPFDIPAFQAPGQPAGEEQTIIDQVLANLQEIFAGSGVIFTTDQPAVGTEYSTIYIGGDDSALAQCGSFLGLAEHVDVSNLAHSDEALVFSKQVTGGSSEEHVETLAKVIAHETGHLLGYVHIDKVSYGQLSGLAFVNSDAQQIVTVEAEVASSVYVADLDGDGDADILSAFYYDDKIAWYENDGSGGFGIQQIITTLADGARSVCGADLDGDGDSDVLSASVYDDKIAWYENDGSGGFGAQHIITVQADAAQSVYATDLDGDGDLDVLSASCYDDKIAYYDWAGDTRSGGLRLCRRPPLGHRFKAAGSQAKHWHGRTAPAPSDRQCRRDPIRSNSK